MRNRYARTDWVESNWNEYFILPSVFILVFIVYG